MAAVADFRCSCTHVTYNGARRTLESHTPANRHTPDGRTPAGHTPNGQTLDGHLTCKHTITSYQVFVWGGNAWQSGV